MSFADELRSAPDNKKRRDEQEWKENIELLIKLLTDNIKDFCLRRAEEGDSDSWLELEWFVEDIESNSVDKEWSDYWGEKDCEIKFDSSEWGRRWRKIRKLFYCYVDADRRENYEFVSGTGYVKVECDEPLTFGMSRVNAERIAALLQISLESEGLSVRWKLTERDYIFHNFETRNYRTPQVKEENTYNVHIEISW